MFIADLHIHSKYSRATSRDCDLENLSWWAARKGITVIGTGDFTHPVWFAELQEKLIEAKGEPGLFRLRSEIEQAVMDRSTASCRYPIRFMLSVEISTIYKRDDRTRKVHHLLYMPSFAAAQACNDRLNAIGNLKSDGRPILGLDSRHLLEIALESGGYLVPAHIWTPWFAALGSQSGFDAIDDCYADLAAHVFAVETGLSSDPEMNWRVSSLDRFQLVSNSDAHSPPALGREATVFDTDISYFAIKKALETGIGLGGTIEFFPEEGKYHLDGHRKCGVVWEPEETERNNGLCKGCGKPVTVGVLHRVEALADRSGDQGRRSVPFRSLISLPQVLGEIYGVGPKTKRVAQEMNRLCEQLGPELAILQDVPIDEIAATSSSLMVEAIERLRRGQVIRHGGYDGEYGIIRLFEPDEIKRRSVTEVLFDVPIAASDQDLSSNKSYEQPSNKIEEIVEDVLGLNSEQQQAVKCISGQLLIIAGPGTGKTRVLTERFAHMISNENVDPSRCLAISFTNRASNELRERLTSLAPRAEAITVCTFHALGLQILREHYEDAGLSSSFRIANSFEEIDKTILSERELVDFDDLIELPLQLLSDHPEIADVWRRRFNWIAVDEYQDIDQSQYRLLMFLLSSDHNLCVVGDPDQAIYSFRGADVGFFLQFQTDFPEAEVVNLTQNYRSSSAIVESAGAAIAPSTLVPARNLRAVSRIPNAADSVSVYEAIDENDEANFVTRTVERLIGGTSLHSFDTGKAGPTNLHISFSDIAILYRTDSQAQPVLDAFEHSGIPVQKRSHNRLIDRPEVGEFARFLVSDQCDQEQPLVDCLDSRPDSLRDLLEPLVIRCNGDRQKFLQALAFGAEIDTWDPRADRVSLLTLHASKGLEFPIVFVIGANDGWLPLRWGHETNLDEERRLFFVGMTRARSHLYVTYARTRFRSNKTQRESVRRSPFLTDLTRVDIQRSTTQSSRQLRLL